MKLNLWRLVWFAQWYARPLFLKWRRWRPTVSLAIWSEHRGWRRLHWAVHRYWYVRNRYRDWWYDSGASSRCFHALDSLRAECPKCDAPLRDVFCFKCVFNQQMAIARLTAGRQQCGTK